MWNPPAYQANCWNVEQWSNSTENSDIDIVVEVEKPSLQLMYELKEALKQLFNCEVDLVRFRDSLRPLFKSNIQRDAIYVWSLSHLDDINQIRTL